MKPENQILNASEFLNLEQRTVLMKTNNWLGIFEIIKTFFWIALAFYIAGWHTHPLTIILAMFILGGKQLACAIIMHDASHYSLFTSKIWNEIVGKFFGAYPIWNDLNRYRPYHVKHHLQTGKETDPDISLTLGYPTSKKSMVRKIIRDLLGITGIKLFLGSIGMHLGLIHYTSSKDIRYNKTKMGFMNRIKFISQRLTGPLLWNIGLFLLFYFLGKPWLYLLWIGSLWTTFAFSLRIRSIAEHSVVDDSLDPFKNTRTTYAGPLEKILFAPLHVNYHVEHHMMMGVPCYNLPKMHKMLLKSGFYKKGVLEKNYWSVVKLAAQKATS